MAQKLTEILAQKESSGQLKNTESQLISTFIFEQQAQRGTRDSTMLTRAWSILRLAELLHKDGKTTLDTATTEDVLRLVSVIRSNNYSKNYQNDLIKVLKRFFLWRIENGGTGLNEKKIHSIKVPGMDWKCKTTEDLLTKEEVLQAIDACSNSRDKAIISMLYDASARPVDLLELKWKDIIFDEYGALFRTSAKTGKERTIRLTPISTPYLSQWRSDYPGEPFGTNQVFISHHKYAEAGDKYVPIENTAILRLIRTLRKKTGNPRLKPSIFRPSRITHDVSDGFDLQYLMLKNWGSLKSSMIEIYAKPGEEYISKYALEKAGVN